MLSTPCRMPRIHATPLAALAMVFATSVLAMPYPSDQFLPKPTLTDSFSVRQTRNDPELYGPSKIPWRYDMLIRSKDATGRPLRAVYLMPQSQILDSAVASNQWTTEIPAVFGSPSRSILQQYFQGTLTACDTTSFHWDPSTRWMVQTSSSDPHFSDSAYFDSQNRRVLESQRGGDPADTGEYSTHGPYHEIYRAWYRNASDSLPQIASERSYFSQNESLDDSVFAVGNPNRPDTLRGSHTLALVRDAAGRVILARPNTGADSTQFSYDVQGRLVREIQFHSKFIDTASYLYSWNDGTGIRQRPDLGSHIRTLAKGIELNLAAPERIRVEQIQPNGIQFPVADRIFPVGRTALPLAASNGSLVRVRSSQGESVLHLPLR